MIHRITMFKWRKPFVLSAAVAAAMVATVLAVPSVASAQEDSLSGKVSSAAPESCLFWYQWANPYNADAGSKNAVDRMLAEPDVNKFCKDFTDKLGQLPCGLRWQPLLHSWLMGYYATKVAFLWKALS